MSTRIFQNIPVFSHRFCRSLCRSSGRRSSYTASQNWQVSSAAALLVAAAARRSFLPQADAGPAPPAPGCNSSGTPPGSSSSISRSKSRQHRPQHGLRVVIRLQKRRYTAPAAMMPPSTLVDDVLRRAGQQLDQIAAGGTARSDPGPPAPPARRPWGSARDSTKYAATSSAISPPSRLDGAHIGLLHVQVLDDRQGALAAPRRRPRPACRPSAGAGPPWGFCHIAPDVALAVATPPAMRAQRAAALESAGSGWRRRSFRALPIMDAAASVRPSAAVATGSGLVDLPGPLRQVAAANGRGLHHAVLWKWLVRS